MAAAYVEHRPHASSKHASTSHYVVIANGVQVDSNFSTRLAAKIMLATMVTDRYMWRGNLTCKIGLNQLIGDLPLVNIRARVCISTRSLYNLSLKDRLRN